VQNNTITNIDKYYRRSVILNSLESNNFNDIVEKYYTGLIKIRKEKTQNSLKTSLLKTAQDKNNPIFSFNFGLSLLDSFIKINFDTFGISILDEYIKT